MKQLKLILILMFFAFIAKAQYPTPYQKLGSLNTAVSDTGGLFIRQTFVPPAYADTTTANLNSFTKYYPGSIIRIGNTLYIRNTAHTQWIAIATGTAVSTFFNLTDVDSTGMRNGYYPVYQLSSGKLIFLPQSVAPDLTPTWAVEDSLDAPQVTTPIVGDKFLVSPTPSGGFAGHANQIATYDGTTPYTFQSAATGDLLANANSGSIDKWTGSVWLFQGRSNLHAGGETFFNSVRIGTQKNYGIGLVTNNLNRLNISKAGAFTFKTLTGASDGLMGLGTGGLASNVQIGSGLDLTAGVLTSTSTTPDLQQVTDVGNTTTNDIDLTNESLSNLIGQISNGTYMEFDAGTIFTSFYANDALTNYFDGSGALYFRNISNSSLAAISPSNLEAGINYALFFPAVSLSNRTIPISVNGAFADVTTGDISANLQTITDVGSTTTHDITANSFTVGSSKAVLYTAGGTGILSLKDGVGAGLYSNLQPTVLTQNRSYYLPDSNGTLVLRVNGTAPDDKGNVTIAISGGTVTNVTGTANRITVATGTTTPVIDISASYVGQSSITTVGTLSAGAVPLSLITGLGTNVATALGVNVGSAGAFITLNGALGTPSSGTLINATGLPTTGLTGTLQAAQEPAHTGDVTNSAGSLAMTIATGAVTDSKGSLLVKPASMVVATSNLTLSGEQTIDGVLSSTSVVLLTGQTSGAENGFWVTAAGAWARPGWYTNGSATQAPQFLTTFIRLGTTYQGTTWRMTTASVTIGTTVTAWVETPLVINATSVANGITGSGSVVLATSPTLISPALGTPSALVGTNITGTASGLTAGNVTTNANLTGDVTSTGNATTLATVNSNVGSFTYASITVNAKGLITAASSGSAPEVPLTFSTGLTRSTNTITADLSTGKSGGLTASGGTAASENLLLQSTTNGTKGYVGITNAPAGTANYGSLSIGSGAFDGSTTGFFAGSASGTQIAVNAASGFGGDLIDLQVAGAKKFYVDNAGIGVFASRLTVGSGGAQTATLSLAATTFSTSSTFSTAGFGINQVSATYTSTTSSGTIASTGINTFAQPTFASSSATTLTGASTVLIANAPAAGSGITITGAFALNVVAGLSVFNGGFSSSNFATTSNLGVVGGQSISTTAAAAVQFSGSSTAAYRALFNGTTSGSLSANNVYANIVAGSTPITAAATGTHAMIANVVINPLGTVTNASAVPITETSTLYVNGAGSGGTTNSALHVASGLSIFGGAMQYAYVSKTGTYTAAATDYMIDCLTNTFTVNLPAAAGIAGRVYIIKNSTTGTTITIDGNASETIDGSTTKTLNVQYTGYQIMSDGTNWKIISAF